MSNLGCILYVDACKVVFNDSRVSYCSLHKLFRIAQHFRNYKCTNTVHNNDPVTHSHGDVKLLLGLANNSQIRGKQTAGVRKKGLCGQLSLCPETSTCHTCKITAEDHAMQP